jgi:hypothetical protein
MAQETVNLFIRVLLLNALLVAADVCPGTESNEKPVVAVVELSGGSTQRCPLGTVAANATSKALFLFAN